MENKYTTKGPCLDMHEAMVLKQYIDMLTLKSVGETIHSGINPQYVSSRFHNIVQAIELAEKENSGFMRKSLDYWNSRK